MPDEDERFTRADLETLVGIAEVQVMLSRGRDRVMWRSQAEKIAAWPSFPRPLVVYPRTGKIHVRLWLPAHVEAWVEEWLDRTRPGWRDNPTVPTE